MKFFPYMVKYQYSQDKIEKTNDLNLKMSAMATSLHYGQQAFEGIKIDGKEDLDFHYNRLKRSCDSCHIPLMSKNIYFKLINKFLEDTSGKIYLRLNIIGINGNLKTNSSDDFLVYIIGYPVKDNLFKVYSAKLEEDKSNMSFVKTGGNYSNFLNKGVVLKTKDGFLTEFSTANIFLYLKNGSLITTLSDNIIIGSTRAKIMQNFKVDERSLRLEEFLDWLANDNILEIIGTSSAMGVFGVSELVIDNKKYLFSTFDKAKEIKKTI